MHKEIEIWKKLIVLQVESLLTKPEKMGCFHHLLIVRKQDTAAMTMVTAKELTSSNMVANRISCRSQRVETHKHTPSKASTTIPIALYEQITKRTLMGTLETRQYEYREWGAKIQKRTACPKMKKNQNWTYKLKIWESGVKYFEWQSRWACLVTFVSKYSLRVGCFLVIS